MDDKRLFDYTDDDGIERIVEITKRLGGNQFSTYQVNIRDVNDGKEFYNIPQTALRERNSE